jgi:hypothetical protein
MKPPRFSLRLLLVVVTSVAMFLWWYTQLPPGTITARQAARIQRGTTKADVLAILGEPLSRKTDVDWGGSWNYRVQSKSPEYISTWLVIFFDGGTGHVRLVIQTPSKGFPP